MNNSSFEPGKFDLVIYRGATYDRLLNVTFDDAADTVWFETNDRIVMQIRESVDDDGAPITTLSTDNGKIVLDPVTSNMRLMINELETFFFSQDNAVYDLEVHHPPSHSRYPNQVTILLAGKVRIKPNITRVTRLDSFGGDHCNIVQFMLNRNIDPNNNINILDGLSEAIPADPDAKRIQNAWVRVLSGEAIQSLGADNIEFFANSKLQFFDTDGNLLFKNNFNIDSPTSFRFLASGANVGNMFYLVESL